MESFFNGVNSAETWCPASNIMNMSKEHTSSNFHEVAVKVWASTADKAASFVKWAKKLQCREGWQRAKLSSVVSIALVIWILALIFVKPLKAFVKFLKKPLSH